MELRYRKWRGDRFELIRVMPAKGRGMLPDVFHTRFRDQSSERRHHRCSTAGTWRDPAAGQGRLQGHDLRARQRGHDAGDRPHGRRHAGAMVREQIGRTRDHATWRSRAGSVARGTAEHPDSSGSLVLAHPRDRADFERFSRLTTHHQRLAPTSINQLEPSLDSRFREALFFPDEGHVERRAACCAQPAHARLAANGIDIRFETEHSDEANHIVVDCRGLQRATTNLPGLRGVKGEMIVVETDEICAVAPGAAAASALAALHHSAREQPLHDRRYLTIESEDPRRRRAFGAGVPSAAYARASGVRRGADCRVQRGTAPCIPRQPLPRIDASRTTPSP